MLYKLHSISLNYVVPPFYIRSPYASKSACVISYCKANITFKYYIKMSPFGIAVIYVRLLSFLINVKFIAKYINFPFFKNYCHPD